MDICDNLKTHMIGNFYVKYEKEEYAQKCF